MIKQYREVVVVARNFLNAGWHEIREGGEVKRYKGVRQNRWGTSSLWGGVKYGIDPSTGYGLG